MRAPLGGDSFRADQNVSRAKRVAFNTQLKKREIGRYRPLSMSLSRLTGLSGRLSFVAFFQFTDRIQFDCAVFPYDFTRLVWHRILQLFGDPLVFTLRRSRAPKVKFRKLLNSMDLDSSP
jgi:hypothetical protein